jgi:TetR/AcrR family transcriptional regulator, regulator of autoinduction and epiphytic fitness
VRPYEGSSVGDAVRASARGASARDGSHPAAQSIHPTWARIVAGREAANPGAVARRGAGSTQSATDRRATRGDSTRQRIIEALISLLQEDEAVPPARTVAWRAGVSLRLVFYHFKDMETLYRMALEAVWRQQEPARRPVDRRLALEVRVAQTVKRRATLYEALSPLRRAVLSLGPGAESLTAWFAAADVELRAVLETTFAAELERAEHRDGILLDAIDAAASWPTWNRLRKDQSLRERNARDVVAQTLVALLQPS